MFSYSFFNSDSQLVRTLVGCGYMLSLHLDGNMYSVGSSGCKPYTN